MRPHRTPIPERIPPLRWRAPALLWTPIALALAIGWPVLMMAQDGGMAQTVLIAGAVTFAGAFITLGASWLFGRPPRTRRVVIVHIVIVGALVSLATPFVLMELLSAVAETKSARTSTGLTMPMSLSMAPLALLLGLPIALFSGIVFAMVALVKKRRAAPSDFDDDEAQVGAKHRHDVQPFA